MISRILFRIGWDRSRSDHRRVANLRKSVFVILRLAGMMISPVSAFTTSRGIFSPSRMLRKRIGELLNAALLSSSCVLRRSLGAAVLVSAGVSFSRETSFCGRHLHVHDDAVSSRGHCQRRVFHIGGFFAENRAKQSLFRSQLRLALRRDFSDENIAGLYLRTDPHRRRPDPRFVNASSLTLGMSRVISSGPSLVSRAPISNSSI